MVRTDKIRGLMAEQGVKHKDMAEAIHVTQKTWTLKMKTGKFGSDEMMIITEKLNIEDPASIFLARE
ncbi:MAG: hypothetical protein LIP02_13765 [Bacteroidales bacterium]|nr:hypothetical protein [Bacteroidales bacterium]MCC8177381.1 hypothetical protein [Bacteroidales bacterium]